VVVRVVNQKSFERSSRGRAIGAHGPIGDLAEIGVTARIVAHINGGRIDRSLG